MAAAALYLKVKGGKELQKALKKRKQINKDIKKMQIKVKTLVGFAQIMTSIGFNCAISFPPLFEKASSSVEVVNLDLLPAFGINCRLSDFNFADKMVAMMLAPIGLCFLLGIAYCYVQRSKGGRFEPSEEQAKKYVVPTELGHAFTSAEVRNFQKVFAAFDTDVSGAIEESELCGIMKEIDSKKSQKEQLSAEEISKQVSAMLLDASSDKRNVKEEVDFGGFLFAMLEARGNLKETNFSKLVDKVEGETNRAKGQGIIYIFLLVTFLVLAGNSTTLFNYLKVRAILE